MSSYPRDAAGDARSPKELAIAILDYPLAIPTAERPSMNFREVIFNKAHTPGAIPHGLQLVWELKKLESDFPRSSLNDERIVNGFATLHSMHKALSAFRDGAKRTAHDADDGSEKKVSHERMVACVSEITNVNAIEKLLRKLCLKLDITPPEKSNERY